MFVRVYANPFIGERIMNTCIQKWEVWRNANYNIAIEKVNALLQYLDIQMVSNECLGLTLWVHLVYFSNSKVILCPRHLKNGGGALSVTPVRPCVRPYVIKIWCPLNNF